MQTYQIEIDRQNAKSRMVSVTLLQSLLRVLVEGSKGALRLRTEGRSTIRGTPPKWIKAATQFGLELQGNQLRVDSPTLSEATPELFQKSDWFPELNSEWTSLDYFQESLTATLNKEMADSLYDKPLLHIFQGFRHVFNQGANQIILLNGNGKPITPETLSVFKGLEGSLPSPGQVKVVGVLEVIRIHDRTFKLITTPNEHVIKGITQPINQKEAQGLLNKEVLVSGIGYFTISGKVLRIEAEHISVAGEQERALWEKLPIPIPYQSKPNELPNELLVKSVPQTDDKVIVADQKPDIENDEEIAKWVERLP
ncbi:MAG: hypothetical protein VSS75_030445 [Candidatus Parabeggiatoa sp.]|nr:hypothetical protein [Candidatus Parabeggiatoa sp.]